MSRRQVRRALELHADDLSAWPEVVGVGAKWDTSKVAKGDDREHAVAVYVETMELSAASRKGIPSVVTIPARKGVHMIPVVLQEVGRIEAEAAPAGDDDEGDGEMLLYAE